MRTGGISSKSRKGRSVVKAAKAVGSAASPGPAGQTLQKSRIFKSIFLLALIEFLQFLILRSEAAMVTVLTISRIFSFIVTHFCGLPSCLDFDIIDVCHVLLLCLLPILSHFYINKAKQAMIVPVFALVLFNPKVV